MELIVLADISVCPWLSQCRSLGVYGARRGASFIWCIGRRHARLHALRCRACDTLIKPSHSDRAAAAAGFVYVQPIVVLTSFKRCYCHRGMCPLFTIPVAYTPHDVFPSLVDLPQFERPLTA